MRVRAHVAIACLSVLLLSGLAATSARADSPPLKPAPSAWEQWQPQTDASDGRLDRERGRPDARRSFARWNNWRQFAALLSSIEAISP